MSDLQIILIILGAFIIAGVLIYNWMQERKLRNQVTREFIVPQKDVLAEDFYIDTDAFVEKQLADLPNKAKQVIFEHTKPRNTPIINNETAFTSHILASENKVANQTPTPSEIKTPSEVKASSQIKTNSQIKAESMYESDLREDVAVASMSDSDVDFVSENTHVESQHAIDSAAIIIKDAFKKTELTKPKTPTSDYIDQLAPKLPLEIHPQIDLTAILYTNKSIQIEALNELVDKLADIGLPVMIHGLDADDRWQLIQANGATNPVVNTAYKQAACSMQLADRSGPVSKSALNKFQYTVENVGLDLNLHVEWQGSGDVMQRALALDQFCIEVDQLISVHVAQNEAPIHGTKLRGLAEANGMTLSNDGKFSYYASNDANAFAKTPLFIAIEANNQPFTVENLRNSVLKAVTFQLEIPKVPHCEQAFNQMILIAQKLSSSLNASLVDDNQKPLNDLQIEKIRQQLKVIHATMVARGVMPGSLSSQRLFN